MAIPAGHPVRSRLHRLSNIHTTHETCRSPHCLRDQCAAALAAADHLYRLRVLRPVRPGSVEERGRSRLRRHVDNGQRQRARLAAAEPGRQVHDGRRPARLLARRQRDPCARAMGRREQRVARVYGPAVLRGLRVCLVCGLPARPARRSAAVQIRVRRRAGAARLRPHARRRRTADPARLLRPCRTRPRNHAATGAVLRHRHARLWACAHDRQADPGRADLGLGARPRHPGKQPGAGWRAVARYPGDGADRARGAYALAAAGRFAGGAHARGRVADRRARRLSR